ncbi:MAG: hypothetical protein FWF96_05740 [Kiritimatiellaeota bacterium]|nr:hypothetical protein [Kiritimatiellota bacterium]
MLAEVFVFEKKIAGECRFFFSIAKRREKGDNGDFVWREPKEFEMQAKVYGVPGERVRAAGMLKVWLPVIAAVPFVRLS